MRFISIYGISATVSLANRATIIHGHGRVSLRIFFKENCFLNIAHWAFNRKAFYGELIWGTRRIFSVDFIIYFSVILLSFVIRKEPATTNALGTWRESLIIKEEIIFTFLGQSSLVPRIRLWIYHLSLSECLINFNFGSRFCGCF